MSRVEQQQENPEIIIRETSPLVSIQDLHFVRFIPKRDKIVIGRVKGFQLIVSRDLFENDNFDKPVRVVYCEADTILDHLHPLFALLKNKDDGLCRTLEQTKHGIRSCGAAFPVSVLKFYKIDPDTIKPNEDLTLRVFARKYIKPADQAAYHPPGAAVLGAFPVDIVPKTDEPRINADEKMWDEVQARVKAGHVPVVTLKYDGTSMTVTGEAEPRVCGRRFVLNQAAKDKSNEHYFQVINALEVCQKLAKTGISLQGEVMGPKIQNNCLGLAQVQWYVFNGYRDGCYLPHAEVERLCKEWGFPVVPRVVVAPDQIPQTLAEWEKLATAQVYPTNDAAAEGIVVKFEDTDKHARLSFKVLSTRYKLEENRPQARKRKPKAV